jgi:hypothetical protein
MNIIEKLKAWIKGIKWEVIGKVVLAIGGTVGSYLLLKKIRSKFYMDCLNDPKYVMELWNKAVDLFEKDKMVEKFNSEWNETHPDFDFNNPDDIEAQDRALDEMFHPYLEKVSKENSIGGKYLDFDIYEPVVFKQARPGFYKPEYHVTVKNLKTH